MVVDVIVDITANVLFNTQLSLPLIAVSLVGSTLAPRLLYDSERAGG